MVLACIASVSYATIMCDRGVVLFMNYVKDGITGTGFKMLKHELACLTILNTGRSVLLHLKIHCLYRYNRQNDSAMEPAGPEWRGKKQLQAHKLTALSRSRPIRPNVW
jgi:hypothetical protein